MLLLSCLLLTMMSGQLALKTMKEAKEAELFSLEIMCESIHFVKSSKAATSN